MSKIKIAIFTDLHYGDASLFTNLFGAKYKLINYALPVLNKLITTLNGSDNDVVICLGDLIRKTSAETDSENLKLIWKELEKLKLNFFTLTGNHEHAYLTMQELQDITKYDSFSYSLNVNGYHFVFIGEEFNVKPDTKNLDKLTVRNEKIEWLKEDLKNNTLPAIIFSHYPFADFSLEDNFWFNEEKRIPYEHFFMNGKEEIFDIVNNDKNVLAVFSGHQHGKVDVTINSKRHYVIGSMTEGFKTIDKPDGNYLEVTIENDNISVIEKFIEV